PTRDKAMLAIEGTQARKSCVDGPQFTANPADFVDADVAAMMCEPRHERGITLAFRLQLRRHVRLVAKFPDLVLGTNCESAGLGLIRNAHRAEELAEVGIERITLGADENQLARLIGRNDQRNVELPQ